METTLTLAETSTNVRLVSGSSPSARPARDPHRAPEWMRAAFRLAGGVAPGVAGRAAERLFLTPPRPAPRPHPALASAHTFTFEHRGLLLAVRSWGDGPTVLLQHGWGGRSDQLAPFVEPLLAAGFSVVAPDMPAHGDSEGRTSSLPGFARAIAALSRRVLGLHGVVAHSMGAAATALAMADGLRVQRAVFLASPTSAVEQLQTFARGIDLPPSGAEALRRRVEARVGVPFSELELAWIAPRMSAPLLVFHDPADREISWRDGAALARAWPGARLVDVPGAGHHRILGDARVVEPAVRFLGDALR